MLRKYLPSKKVVALLILPVIIIIILILWNFYLKNKNNQVIKNDLSGTISTLNKEIDTDGDGLYDWEEDLIGTNKNKKDTDGDGLLDSLEVKTGSDPLDPLNRKKNKKEILKDGQDDSYKFDDNLTLTQKVARQFLDESMKLQKSGMSFNKDAQSKVVDKIISQNKIHLDWTKYSLGDLNIGNFSKEEFKKEFSKVSDSLKKYNLREEVYLLDSYWSTKDTKYLKEIKYNVSIYEKILKDMLALKTPDSISKEYLDFINAFNVTIETDNLYLSAEGDPVSLIQAMSMHKEVDGNLEEKFNNFVKKVKEK